jgi:hypothetical protein
VVGSGYLSLTLRRRLAEQFDEAILTRFGMSVAEIDARMRGNWSINTPAEERTKIEAYAQQEPSRLGRLRRWPRVAAGGVAVLIVLLFFKAWYWQRKISGRVLDYSAYLVHVVKPSADDPEKGHLDPSATDRLVRLLELEQWAKRLKARSECFLNHNTSSGLTADINTSMKLSATMADRIVSLKEHLGRWNEAASRVKISILELHEVKLHELDRLGGVLESSVGCANRLGRAADTLSKAHSPGHLTDLTSKLDDFRASLAILLPPLDAMLTHLSRFLDQVFGNPGSVEGYDPCVNDGFPTSPSTPKPGDSKPGGGRQPGDSKPSNGKPRDSRQAGDAKPGGHSKPDDGQQPVDSKPSDGKPGDSKQPGDAKPGSNGKPSDPSQGQNSGQQRGNSNPSTGASSPNTSTSVGNYRRGETSPDGNMPAGTRGDIGHDIQQGIPVSGLPPDGSATPGPPPDGPPPYPGSRSPPTGGGGGKGDPRPGVDTPGMVTGGSPTEGAAGRAGQPPIVPPSK